MKQSRVTAWRCDGVSECRRRRNLTHSDGNLRRPSSADFQICCIAGFPARRRRGTLRAGDFQIPPTWKSAIQQARRPALRRNDAPPSSTKRTNIPAKMPIDGVVGRHWSGFVAISPHWSAFPWKKNLARGLRNVENGAWDSNIQPEPRHGAGQAQPPPCTAFSHLFPAFPAFPGGEGTSSSRLRIAAMGEALAAAMSEVDTLAKTWPCRLFHVLRLVVPTQPRSAQMRAASRAPRQAQAYPPTSWYALERFGTPSHAL